MKTTKPITQVHLGLFCRSVCVCVLEEGVTFTKPEYTKKSAAFHTIDTD